MDSPQFQKALAALYLADNNLQTNEWGDPKDGRAEFEKARLLLGYKEKSAPAKKVAAKPVAKKAAKKAAKKTPAKKAGKR